MFKAAGKLTLMLLLMVGSMVAGALLSHQAAPDGEERSPAQVEQPTLTPSLTVQPAQTALPTETIPPYTPLPSLTPSQTLKPAPTFEPPTTTPTASPVPSQTPVPTTSISVSIPGLNGAETPTPSTTPGCQPRDDWKLTYTVQFDDTLSSIADKYGTWVNELVAGNCITDKNLIVIGQVLRVPGQTQPNVDEIACVTWEPMTPFNGSVAVPADGSITFNWRGPAAPLNLIRIFRPDGSMYERLVELRQNDTINLNDYLSQEGMYTWYVFPLGSDFRQISCLEGGPWTFYKPLSSTPTATASAGGGSMGN